MARRNMRNTTPTPVDPAAADWHDIQEHQYTPGYYTGRNLAPHLRQPRPGKIGYAFVAMGVLDLVMTVIALGAVALATGTPPVLVFLAPAALGLLMLASGLRLLRR